MAANKSQYEWQVVATKSAKKLVETNENKIDAKEPKPFRTNSKRGNNTSNNNSNSTSYSKGSNNSYKNAAVHHSDNQRKAPVKRVYTQRSTQKVGYHTRGRDDLGCKIKKEKETTVVGENSTSVLDLPLEILIEILSHLSWIDQKACSLACSSFFAASRWFRRAVRPSRFKRYEDLIAAYPRLKYLVLDSCTTAVPLFRECMSKLCFIDTLVLWNTPKALLQGKFPPDDSPWTHTVRKLISDSADPPPNVEWNFRNVEELEIFGGGWDRLVKTVASTVKRIWFKTVISFDNKGRSTIESFRKCKNLEDLYIECDEITQQIQLPYEMSIDCPKLKYIFVNVNKCTLYQIFTEFDMEYIVVDQNRKPKCFSRDYIS